MTRPLVSIIIPAYNAEAYLQRCLDSIFSQEFTDYEVIVIDENNWHEYITLPDYIIRRREKKQIPPAHFSDLLRLECPKWFIVDDCLPPMQEWTSRRFDYQVDDARRKRIQQLVKDTYQGWKREGL